MSINVLPDEVLLSIFRKLTAVQFITSVPLVCTRWLNIIVSDTHTLNHIGMYHMNVNNSVDFFFYKSEELENNLNCLPHTHHCLDHIVHKAPISYCDAFYLCTQYSNLFSYIKTLVISNNLNTYVIEGFTYVNNITTIEFFDVTLLDRHVYTLLELGAVYPSIENVMYVQCLIRNIGNQHLHNGFKQLKQFRMDHYSITHGLLEDLLNSHPTIKTIVLNNFSFLNDRWFDVLIKKLKGRRTIKSLCIHSPYVTDKSVNQFLTTSNLFIDKSKVNIYRDKGDFPFSISID